MNSIHVNSVTLLIQLQNGSNKTEKLQDIVYPSIDLNQVQEGGAYYTECSEVKIFIPSNAPDPRLPSTLLMMSAKSIISCEKLGTPKERAIQVNE